MTSLLCRMKNVLLIGLSLSIILSLTACHSSSIDESSMLPMESVYYDTLNSSNESDQTASDLEGNVDLYTDTFQSNNTSSDEIEISTDMYQDSFIITDDDATDFFNNVVKS